MYEAEQTAKAEAINDEHKAVLKEIKHTKEHERKCITKMWNAESEARVKAVQSEAEEWKALMREGDETQDGVVTGGECCEARGCEERG